MTASTPSLIQLPDEPTNDEIDLRQVVGSLRRRWKLIGSITAAGVVLSGIVSLLLKPVWEGEFQIVLASDQGAGGKLAQLAAANPLFSGLAGLSGGGESNLETEVTVLQSPSVLRPVFEFVKSSKQRAGQNVNQLRYESWAEENLDVELEKGTSVLNISYRDTDQDLVLPVIQRISRAYQEYSGRDRRRDISNAVAFLRERISELEPTAEASMRKAQAFALANGLALQDGVSAVTNNPNPGTAGGASVEAERQEAQLQVLSLRQQLANARAAGSAVLFQAPQLDANKELYTQYQQLQSQLAEKRSRLYDNDLIIRNLERQKQALVSTLNRETIALLEGQLATAEGRLQSATRPRDVVLRHRELMRQALRDEKTLTELENQLQITELEQAKRAEPWELISTPTLLDNPVSPRKKRNLALGLLAGLVIGSGAALIAERRSGRVFSVEELAAALPGDLLAELPSADAAASGVSWLQLLADGPLAVQAGGSVGLVPVGLDPHSLEPLRKALEEACQRPVFCSADLVASRSCSTQLLVASPGAATREQISSLCQQLRLQGAEVAGWVLLSEPRP